jgi:hypothetical protein
MQSDPGTRRPRWGRLRALGMWGFLFFLVKGLLWLAVPAVIAAWRWMGH